MDARRTTPRGRSGRTVTLVVGVCVLACLLLAASLACLASCVTSQDSPEIRTDQAVVDDWKTALAPALADLNAVEDVPGLRAAEPAVVRACSFYSGDLIDLSAGRWWDATDRGRDGSSTRASVTASTGNGFTRIVARLRAAGWQVRATEDVLGQDLPAGLDHDSVDLDKEHAGHTLWLSLQVWDDGVLAVLDYDTAERACSSRD